MKRINSIAGIALHYARETQYPYGSKGRPASFLVLDDFFETLETCFEELNAYSPLGTAEIMTTAGIYVNKPGSEHRTGAAFDLDALFWKDYHLISRNFHQDYELYLGIESIIRKHFGVVLNYFYNDKHKDHWHIDSGTSVNFTTSSKSKVIYVQLVATYSYGLPVLVDGIWGNQTAGAVKEMFVLLDLTGKITSKRTWMSFLDKTAKVSFALFEQSKNPSRLLDDLYATLLDVNVHSNDRAAVLQALNNFRNHQATDKWLSKFGDPQSLEAIIKGVA